jgi:hypothetical protein
MKEVHIMRKTLSIILSAIMLLSVVSFAVPVSAAPEGIAINTADEFLAMVSTPADATEPTAKYYLASDITLPSSYAEPFWGILDGNGKTVTVSAPMFNDFSGEVMNLTIKGEIVYADANAAAFTTLSSKAFKATNCTNNANVTVTGTGKWAAGFVADCEKTADACVFTNCVNNGNIYIDSVAKEKMRGGGFGGIIDSCGFYNCTNNGNVYAKGNIPIVGGFVGRVALNTPGTLCDAINCVNTGDITADETYLIINEDGTTEKGNGGSDAGGIFGYIGGSGNLGWYRVWGCVNEGKIDAPYRAGGFIGYAWASGTNAYVDIQFCINKGDIVFGRVDQQEGKNNFDWGSPFVAYTNSDYTTIKYSIDAGTLTIREGTISQRLNKVFVGHSSCNGAVYDVQSVYLLDKDQYTWFSWSSDDKYEANRNDISVGEGLIVTTLDEIKSGKVCYEIMQAALADAYGYAGSEPDDDMDAYAFYQKIGTDAFPTIDPAAGWVVLNGTTYANGEKPAETTKPEETTKAPEETTKAPEDETTVAPEGDATEAPSTQAPATTDKVEEKGCGGFVAGSVAIVAILGTALIAKKRD